MAAGPDYGLRKHIGIAIDGGGVRGELDREGGPGHLIAEVRELRGKRVELGLALREHGLGGEEIRRGLGAHH